jgi:SAM-dependent methyltransferase
MATPSDFGETFPYQSVVFYGMEIQTGEARDCRALRAFEAMAPAYDDFTALYDYEGWLADLLAVIEQCGLRGNRLLDVACGTGKSFLPMLPRGWEVSACDLSPAMLKRAREKTGASVELLLADMRNLPKFGEFDLVWALDDALNYLLSTRELEDALRGMRNNLADGGLLLFDVNQSLVYRTFYSETSSLEHGDRRFIWQGLGQTSDPSGSVYESRLDVESISRDTSGDCREETSFHRQRHFSEREVRDGLDRASLECVEVYGHGLDGIPRQPLDLAAHTKAIYIARRV